MTISQTAPVSDEELDQMIWKLERDGMTPKMLSLMRELREVRRAKGEPVAWTSRRSLEVRDKITAFTCKESADNYGMKSAWEDVVPLYAAQPEPVVPDALPECDDEDGNDIDYLEPSQVYGLGRIAGWNACRAAMLQVGNSRGTPDEQSFWNWLRDEMPTTYRWSRELEDTPENSALITKGKASALDMLSAWKGCSAAMQLSGNSEQLEHVSNRDELPLDYLQGHKDGLAWAAQLAEANHPQTGDWLYDDPVALAAAIRKGPDMPEFKSVSVDGDDNFYSWFGRFWYENYQQNNYTASAKQMLGTMAEFAYRAGRESAARAGNSPATPDGWIPVSERMPDRDYVLAADISGAYYPPHLPNTQVGIYADWFGDGKPSWDDGDGNDLHLKQVTHWMPLPEPPMK